MCGNGISPTAAAPIVRACCEDHTSTAERKGGTHLGSGNERFCIHGPAEGLRHGCVEVSDELLDLGAQVLLGGDVAPAKKFSHQNGEPASSAISRWLQWLIGRSLSDGFSQVIA